MTEAEKTVITKYDLYYEQRMTRVEEACNTMKSDIAEIKIDIRDMRKDFQSDFKWILGIMGTMTVIIVGLMAHGFKWF